jgi:pyruvate kinase
MNLPEHKTKIVATIGPASQSPPVLEQMIRAGLNVARLNFSHGDFTAHQGMIAALRTAAAAVGRRVAIMADLSGPKIRIGNFAQGMITLNREDRFTLTTDDVPGDQQRVSVSFTKLPEVVHTGDTLFLDDGNIQLEVKAVRGHDVACTVRVGGELRSRKGLNLPGIDLGICAFTARDRECLQFALEHGVDAVSQSFVESAEDLQAVRQAAQEFGRQPFLIAKIERTRALDRLDEIIEAADGIMIARGDLGVEVPIERMAIVQKDIMRRANQRGKPVITATQMLESMTVHRLPTRAEATDVANAILDGTDCLMLSGESATGNYPVEAVAMLARIAAAVEPTRRRLATRELLQGLDLPGRLRPEHLIALSVDRCIEYATPALVFVPTLSGASARRMAALRLPVWTVAASPHECTCQQLQFSYGVAPLYEPQPPDPWNDYVKAWVQQQGLPGTLVFLTGGPSQRHAKANNRLEIIDLTAARE